jgi:hypothetical protein
MQHSVSLNPPAAGFADPAPIGHIKIHEKGFRKAG